MAEQKTMNSEAKLALAFCCLLKEVDEEKLKENMPLWKAWGVAEIVEDELRIRHEATKNPL